MNTMDEFFNGDINEFRIISNFGMAGKIYNVDERIFIKGHSFREISDKDYEKEIAMIGEWNKEIAELIEKYA